MSKTVDLNADMGESFGPWIMGDDMALLDIVTSANIACGFHGGDWDVMADTMSAAVARGVGLGAHPGFNDLQGFGRQRMDVPAASLANMIRYQIGAAQAMARASGGQIRHLKLHGALANMCAEDMELARSCYRAALSVAPDLIIMVLAGTAQQAAVAELGCAAACEIFADRAYNDDATLVDRRLPGAVIHDAEAQSNQALTMATRKEVKTYPGETIALPVQTICVHGDTPGAFAAAQSIKATLKRHGITLCPPT